MKVNNPFILEMTEKMVDYNRQLEQLIDTEKPDLFIVDNFIIEPAILQSRSIPWILVFSLSPVMVYNSTELPPFTSGFPTNSDKSTWTEYRKVLSSVLLDQIVNKQNTLLRKCNYPELGPEVKDLIFSKFLNIYSYPEELDYDDVVPRPENFFRMDTFCRKECELFQLPEDFKQKIKNGDKLIYVSMGSMGGMDLDLMRRLISALAKTPHKYIVSKGPLHEELELADNMWGEAFLPQTSILPLVDLVITHGGNNTVTETFNFGKPMIVLPLFVDQYDNPCKTAKMVKLLMPS